ncbi:3191_t:CDS:2 [Gigaspora margarita]|uniref:3191_t:CDS:1 n=1 Tax=Gigaspora margarita TaxID=4874 RepID=A0ABN7VKM5_GIGMA|nr:3191_t:CDS:2 [Gigaspora margarita]
MSRIDSGLGIVGIIGMRLNMFGIGFRISFGLGIVGIKTGYVRNRLWTWNRQNHTRCIRQVLIVIFFYQLFFISRAGLGLEIIHGS